MENTSGRGGKVFKDITQMMDNLGITLTLDELKNTANSKMILGTNTQTRRSFQETIIDIFNNHGKLDRNFERDAVIFGQNEKNKNYYVDTLTRMKEIIGVELTKQEADSLEQAILPLLVKEGQKDKAKEIIHSMIDTTQSLEKAQRLAQEITNVGGSVPADVVNRWAKYFREKRYEDLVQELEETKVREGEISHDLIYIPSTINQILNTLPSDDRKAMLTILDKNENFYRADADNYDMKDRNGNAIENIGVAEARRIAQTIVNVISQYDYFNEQQLGKLGDDLIHNMQEQRVTKGSVDVSKLASIIVQNLGDKKLKRQDIGAIEQVVLEYRREDKVEQDKFKQVLRTLVGYRKPRTQENENNFEFTQMADDSSSYDLSKEGKTIEINGEVTRTTLPTKPHTNENGTLNFEEQEAELVKEVESTASAWKMSTARDKNRVFDKNIENIRNRYLIAKLQELELNCGTNGFAMLLKEQQEKRVQYLHKVLDRYVDKRDFEANKYDEFVKALETNLKDVIEPTLYANREALEKQVRTYIGTKGSSALVQEVLSDVRNEVWQDGSALTSYVNVAGAQVDLQAKVAALEANHGKDASIVQWRIEEYEQLKLMSSQVRSMVLAVVNHKATIDNRLKEIATKLEKDKNTKVQMEELESMTASSEDMAKCTKAMTDSLYALLRLNKVDIADWCTINSGNNVAPLRFRDKANFKEHFTPIIASMGEVDLTNEEVKKQIFYRAVSQMIDGKERAIFIDWIEDNIKSMYTRSGIQKTTANAILQLLHAELILLGENRKETKIAIQDLIKTGKLEEDQVKLLVDSGMIGDPSNEDENENGDSGSNGGGDSTKKDPEQAKKKEEDIKVFEWVTGEAKDISAEQLKEIVKARNKGKFTVMGTLANFMEKSLVTLGLACNTSKSMKTPSIDKVVKQREKAEKKEAKRQAKLENDPLQNALKSQDDIYKPTVPMDANFEGDKDLFVRVDGKEYTYEDINKIVLDRFKEEMSNSTIDEDKIKYLLAVIAQLNKYKSDEKSANDPNSLQEKKEKFFEGVVKDNLELEVGFDVKYPLNSWMRETASIYLAPIAKDIKNYLKEDGSLDLQKIGEALKDLETQNEKDEEQPTIDDKEREEEF